MIATQRTGLSVWCILFLLGAMLLAYALPGLGEVETRPHAVQRHGEDAIIAREATQHSGPGNRYDCKDGRTRIVTQINARRWAVSVLDGTVEVTAFTTEDREYIGRMLEDCSAQWRFLHP